MKHQLSRRCRVFVITVGCVGMLPLTWAAWNVFLHPPHWSWYLLAGAALLNGPLSIRMPSMHATISVSEGTIFTSALLFGPAAATVVAALDGLAVSLWSRRRSRIQTLFGVGEPALSVFVASLVFYSLANVPPLLNHEAPFVPLLVPVLVLTAVYFSLNTLLAGTAVWLETGGAPMTLLRQHLPTLTLDMCVSLSLVAAVIQTSGSPALSAMVVLVPIVLAGYISSHHTAGRLEDTNRHLSELRRLHESTVEAFAMAIDAKDQITHGHIRRVQLLSGKLARALGATDADVQALEAAALLHDLGKLAIPERILNKPGRLTSAEYDAMKKHADVGASILSRIDFPFPVVPIVRHHHENWDGTGYPDGLKGLSIPMGARILAVVDCYDALTSDRPYRARMTHDEAMEIINSRRGRMYDPSVVDVFVRIHPRPDAQSDIAARDVPPFPPPTDDLQPSPRVAIDRFSMPVAPKYRARVERFLATLHDRTWEEAGRAVAAFVPTASDDAVAALFHVEVPTGQLVLVGKMDQFHARVPERMALGHGVTGWVAASKESVINANAEFDLGEIARITCPPLRLCMSVPLIDRDTLLGVLTVYSPYAFNETDQMLVESIAKELPLAFARGAADDDAVALSTAL